MDDQTIKLGFQVDTSQVAAAVRGQQQLKAAVDATGDASQKAADKAAGAAQKVADATTKASSKVAGLGQSFLQTGRIVQDFAQGGIGGILNNIEGLVMALGGPTGLAGILTVVGVGFMLLKPKIMEFINSLNVDQLETFKGGIDALKAKIKELEEKPIRLGVDNFELTRLKKEVDDLIKATEFAQRLMTKQTKNEAASGRAVDETLVETEGARKAIDREKQKVIDKSIAESKTVQANDKIIAEGEARVKELEIGRANLRAAGLGDAGLSRDIRNLESRIETAKESNRVAKEQLAATEGAKFNKTGLTAVEGRGVDQAKAQEAIAKILENAGLKDAAEDIRAHSVKNFKEGTNPEEVEASSIRTAEKSHEEAQEAFKKEEAVRAQNKHDIDAIMGSDDDAATNSWREHNKKKAEEKKELAEAKKLTTEQQKAIKELVQQFDGKAIMNIIGQSMMRGMNDGDLATNTAKFLKRNTNIPADQRQAVAAGLVGKVRENFDAFKAERAAMGAQFGGNALGGMPGFRPARRAVGKRNMAIRAQARAKAARPKGLPDVKPFRGAMPVPSIGTMPELKIEGNDKSVSLLETQVKQNAMMVASLDAIARKPNEPLL